MPPIPSQIHVNEPFQWQKHHRERQILPCPHILFFTPWPLFLYSLWICLEKWKLRLNTELILSRWVIPVFPMFSAFLNPSQPPGAELYWKIIWSEKPVPASLSCNTCITEPIYASFLGSKVIFIFSSPPVFGAFNEVPGTWKILVEYTNKWMNQSLRDKDCLF